MLSFQNEDVPCCVQVKFLSLHFLEFGIWCLEFIKYLIAGFPSKLRVMGWIKTRNKWANAHSYYWIDLLRIVLGVFLIVKGTDFMSNDMRFQEVMQPFEDWPGSWLIMHYVIGAHFIGGFFLIFGLFTRLSAGILIPVMMGAVLANLLGPIDTLETTLALVTFVACIYFFVNGPGKHSVVYYLKMQQ